jgi:hypothetical protein|tara:strand:+ start:138 stop:290 length:153 start_codon:yes stop_codon:yes gene_type:complete
MTGPDAGENKYLYIETYESRAQCEFHMDDLLSSFEVPEGGAILCLRTDED